MKFFSWMQSKLNGGQGNREANAVPITNQRNQEASKEEFKDWPDSLLAIGTFGNTSHEQKTERQQVQNHEDEQNSTPELAEFTPEEIGKLQKELTKLLTRKPAAKAEAEANADLPLDRFLNCPSSLEVDRRISNALSTNSTNYDYDEDEIDRTIRAIIGRCKNVCSENKKKAIGKKSISFLVKKMFVCSSGFAPPTPSLRDTLQESRMEKLLRTMLSKKMYPQSASRGSSTRRYLEDRHKPREEEEDKRREKTCDGSKWVKTDSEFIVLEI